MARTPSTMLALGTPAPDFALPDCDGRRHALTDFAAAPALLVAVLEPLIAQTEEATLARLDDITLEDLYARAVAEGFGDKPPTGDFDI